MAKFVILKRGGVPGKVAINVELVTDVRSSPGQFTDVFCGAHQITVEGSFESIVSLLGGSQERRPQSPQYLLRQD